MNAISSVLHTLVTPTSRQKIVEGRVGKLAPGSEKSKEIQKVVGQAMDAHPHEEDQNHLYDPYEFIDDVAGKPLDKEFTTDARRLGETFQGHASLWKS